MPLVLTGSGTITGINATDGLSSPQSNTVLQVVNATYSVETSSSSSTYSDTGLTATITPKFSTSKILVLVSQVGLQKSNNEGIRLRLVRGSTTIVQMETAAAYTNTTTQNRVGGTSTTYLDSPSTTSATTYKTQFGTADNAASGTVQSGSTTSTITLLEIAV
jgi:hypothetical protein